METRELLWRKVGEGLLGTCSSKEMEAFKLEVRNIEVTLELLSELVNKDTTEDEFKAYCKMLKF